MTVGGKKVLLITVGGGVKDGGVKSGRSYGV